MAIDTAGRLRGSSFVVGLIILCGSLFALSIAKDEALNLGTVIGIDLGTTYSCVGVYKNGRVEIIANDQGNRVTPSWVAFTDDDGERLIGEAAKNQSNLNAERTIFDVKRLIGREFEDEEIQRQMKRVPYKIVNNDGKPSIQVKFKNGDTKVFSPEEINAVILTKMKEIAEAFLGKKIKDAVITVPVYFNLAQRQATKDAGIIAGLNITSIINEPTAAAISYGLHENGGDKRNILIFHLGGRTFDISILNIDDYVFEVLAENSDTYLGGEDFDQRIMEYFIKLINNNYRKDISKDNVALGKLRRAAERAKRDLSSRHQVSVEIESLFDDDTDFSEPLTRACFEELNDDLFRKIVQGPVVKKSMQDAGLDKSQIDEIVLVGGSTRIPKIQQLLKEYFNGKELNKGVDPDEVVAYGAALQGGIISGELESIRTNDKKGPGVSQEEIERLFREALEKDGLEDSIYGCYNPRERIEARYILETRLYGMNRQINDKVKLADKLSSDEKDKIEAAMMKALEWLEENSQTAEKEDYEEKLKEFEDMCNPIIADVYQRSGGPSAKGSKDFDDGRD